MVQGPSEEAIEALRNPSSLEEQVATLKKLKNDIVGHEPRKEVVVRQGIIEALVDILASAGRATGKRRAEESNGIGQAPPSPWSREDEVRLQTIQLLGSLANAGRAFVPPLLAAGAHLQLVESLGAEVHPPIVTATLQAICSLAASARSGGDASEAIHLEVFSSSLSLLLADLSRTAATASAKQQLKLTTEILSLSATTENACTQLADSGALETLAALLVSYGISEKHFDYRGAASNYPPPPPPFAISSLLKAITAIIGDSKFRAQKFILCAPIRGVITNSTPTNGDRHPFSSRADAGTTPGSMLPPLFIPPTKSVSFMGNSAAWPTLKGLQMASDRRGGQGGFLLHQQSGDIEYMNTVIGWLIYTSRSMYGYSQLLALRLLALLNRAIEPGSELVNARNESLQRFRERERSITLLAVPIAVAIVKAVSEGPTKDVGTLDEREKAEVKEEACEVLALLTENNKELQQAAVEAGAVKSVCQLLKKTFDNVVISKPMWTSKPAAVDQSAVPDTRKLGSRGLPSEIIHTLRCRISALRGLAALAQVEDVHRKAMVEAGVLQCIVDSLKPLPPDFRYDPRSNISAKDGNTQPVLLAACDAIRSMSRSVHLLRTSLIDAGVAKPILELIKHQDLAVKIAATNALCNLVLDFSPMRDDLLAGGVVETLGNHAKQSELELRLSSLWALKHLAMNSNKDTRIQIIEKLGTGWLVRAIQGESHPEPAATSFGAGVSVGGLSTPNAAGEQVNLLNPMDMAVDDPPQQDTEEDDDEDEDEDEDGEIMYDEASSTQYRSSGLRSTLHRSHGASTHRPSTPPLNADQYLASYREMEQDPMHRAKSLDAKIQEQALDLVRNTLNGEECAYMVEWFLDHIGAEKFFSLLTEKLAPIPASAIPHSSNGHSGIAAIGNRPVYTTADLIRSAIYVLVHIANGAPKHKTLLIAQKDLLRAWLPHFNHPDRTVRVTSVWVVNSLTWAEDDADREGARFRARELQLCGIVKAVRDLSNDVDLDVKERVRTALRQLEGLGG